MKAVVLTAHADGVNESCHALRRPTRSRCLRGLVRPIAACGVMGEALAFAAGGQVKADIDLQPLSAFDPIFERLEGGDVPSRVVRDFVGR